MYQIFECSPKAKKLIVRTEGPPPIKNNHWRAKYPFGEMLIGQSFTVLFNEVKEGSLRNLASKYSTEVGRKFTVIRHNEFNCFEVARIG